jgi:hypothetical protein
VPLNSRVALIGTGGSGGSSKFNSPRSSSHQFRAMFRLVRMTVAVPDYKVIAETLFLKEGFYGAKAAAKKLILTLKLAQDRITLTQSGGRD